MEVGQARVVAVREGSDAARQGIHPGDRITRVGENNVEAAITDRLGFTALPPTPPTLNVALLSVLTGRAHEVRTFTITDPAGNASRTVTLPLDRHFDRDAGPLSCRILQGNVGLLRFNNSLSDQATVGAFDTALKSLHGTRALILDLRDTPSGGTSAVALGIMGRLVTSMQPYQRHRIPNYGQSDVQRNWIELVAPRGTFPYTAPITVLVNHWTGSMGEGIAIGLDAMHRGVVIGTPMSHLAGAVSDFTLPLTGTDVAFATEQLFHVNGTPRQDWLPPVLVPEPFASGPDPILTEALHRLGAKAAP